MPASATRRARVATEPAKAHKTQGQGRLLEITAPARDNDSPTPGNNMLIFITAVGVVLVASFLCSIFESVLLSLTRPQIEMTASRHAHAGRLLARFKDNIDVPIAAILILNTAAHTIGAAVAGASYASVFDAGTLWIFSILFTLAVLLLTASVNRMEKIHSVPASKTLA